MSARRYFYATDVATHELSTGGQLFLFSVREWKLAMRFGYSLNMKLEPLYARFNVTEAIQVVDELMHHLAITANRIPKINCPCKTTVSSDEFSLVNSMIALQKDDLSAAIESTEGLMRGSFARTFHRIGQAYVDDLTSNNLSLSGLGRLRLVTNPTNRNSHQVPSTKQKVL